MKKFFRSIVAVLLIMALLSSCKNSAPKQAKYIPKTASFVLVLDAKSMQDKLQKGGISTEDLMKKIFHQDSLDIKDKARVEDFFNNAGIDWKSQLFFFMLQKTTPDKAQVNIFNVMGSLDDAAKLEAFLTKQPELKAKVVKKEANYSYMMVGDGSMVSWNDKQLITTIYNHTAKPIFDTVTMSFKRPTPMNAEAELKKEVANFFTQKEDASLASVPVFTDMFKEKADGYAFTGSNGSLSALSMLPLQLPKLEELIKDNYSASTLSFEDGKIVAKSTTYTNKMLSSILKEYAGPTVNLSMIEHYPSSKINGIMLASFNPEIFGGVLKQLEVEGLVNGFLQKTGLSSQDLYKSLKGDIAVVVSDLGTTKEEPQERKDESSMVHSKRLGKMIFNATVGDKASFAKLMDKVTEQGFLVKNGTTYKGGSLLSALGLFVIADDKNLIIASDSVTYAQYMSNTAKAVINSEVLDRFKGKSMAAYFDIANTLGGFTKDTSASGYNKSLKTAQGTFKDVIATSDNFDGKSIKGVMEVRMQNEKQNSLVTLTSLLTDVAVDMRAQAKREKEMEERLFPAGVPAIIRTN